MVISENEDLKKAMTGDQLEDEDDSEDDFKSCQIL
jgi:hypothetical protein